MLSPSKTRQDALLVENRDANVIASTEAPHPQGWLFYNPFKYMHNRQNHPRHKIHALCGL